MKNTLLEIFIYATYYKGDITERYAIRNNNVAISNKTIDKLIKNKELLYIIPFKEVAQKNKEINNLEEYVKQIFLTSGEFTQREIKKIIKEIKDGKI